MSIRSFLSTTLRDTKIGGLVRPLGEASWSSTEKVAVLGGGIAGLTAAHELAERGFQVTVFEKETCVGGKAASRKQKVRKFSASAGECEPHKPGNPEDCTTLLWPVEHGFRHFPSFYRHLTDTLRRIPEEPLAGVCHSPEDGQPANYLGRRRERTGRSVADHLIPTEIAASARRGDGIRAIPRTVGQGLDGAVRLMKSLAERLEAEQVSENDAARLQLRLLQYLTSCRERREETSPSSRHAYGHRSWRDFLGDGFDPRFMRQCNSFIQTMVAADATKGGAWTIGNTAMQLFLDLGTMGGDVDRILDGPSSDVWIDRWRDYLRLLGVEFKLCARVKSIELTGTGTDGRQRPLCVHFEQTDEWKEGMPKVPTAIRIDNNPGKEDEYGYLVVALPFHVVRALLRAQKARSLVSLDQRNLGWLRDADLDEYTAWMTGVQLYLKHDVPLVRGNVYYPESPWRLSSISQAQFWGPDFRRRWVKPEAKATDKWDEIGGILSVDVCDWFSPSPALQKDGSSGKASDQENAKVVAEEVWRQIAHELDLGSKVEDDPKTLCVAYHVDSVTWEKSGDGIPAGKALNKNPYFVHPPGAHVLRPTSKTNHPRLFLAGEYVATNTDLATMEGANESARRAVNALLEAANWRGQVCDLWELREPATLDDLKALDEDLFRRGSPHVFEKLGLLDRARRGSPRGGAQAAADIAALAVTTGSIPGGLSGLF